MLCAFLLAGGPPVSERVESWDAGTFYSAVRARQWPFGRGWTSLQSLSGIIATWLFRGAWDNLFCMLWCRVFVSSPNTIIATILLPEGSWFLILDFEPCHRATSLNLHASLVLYVVRPAMGSRQWEPAFQQLSHCGLFWRLFIAICDCIDWLSHDFLSYKNASVEIVVPSRKRWENAYRLVVYT